MLAKIGSALHRKKGDKSDSEHIIEESLAVEETQTVQEAHSIQESHGPKEALSVPDSPPVQGAQPVQEAQPIKSDPPVLTESLVEQGDVVAPIVAAPVAQADLPLTPPEESEAEPEDSFAAALKSLSESDTVGPTETATSLLDPKEQAEPQTSAQSLAQTAATPAAESNVETTKAIAEAMAPETTTQPLTVTKKPVAELRADQATAPIAPGAPKSEAETRSASVDASACDEAAVATHKDQPVVAAAISPESTQQQHSTLGQPEPAQDIAPAKTVELEQATPPKTIVDDPSHRICIDRSEVPVPPHLKYHVDDPANLLRALSPKVRGFTDDKQSTNPAPSVHVKLQKEAESPISKNQSEEQIQSEPAAITQAQIAENPVDQTELFKAVKAVDTAPGTEEPSQVTIVDRSPVIKAISPTIVTLTSAKVTPASGPQPEPELEELQDSGPESTTEQQEVLPAPCSIDIATSAPIAIPPVAPPSTAAVGSPITAVTEDQASQGDGLDAHATSVVEVIAKLAQVNTKEEVEESIKEEGALSETAKCDAVQQVELTRDEAEGSAVKSSDAVAVDA